MGALVCLVAFAAAKTAFEMRSTRKARDAADKAAASKPTS